MSSKLAFPGWSMGQVLLPQQFRALQETILAHMGLRSALQGLPAYGLARLQWDDELIPVGAFHIHKLTYVFRSGLLVDVPGNTEISNFNLKGVDLDAARNEEGKISVWLHVRKAMPLVHRVKQYDDDEEGVERAMYEAVLSVEPRLDDAAGSEKLAELRHRNGAWELLQYSPPLLRVGKGASVFLRDELERIRTEVQRLEAQLELRSSDTTVSPDQLAEQGRVRASAYRVMGLLDDHGFTGERVVDDGHDEVGQHPYHLFRALREFYAEFALLQGQTPEGWPIRYRHDDPAGCFGRLGDKIARHIGESPMTQPMLDFERSGAWFVTGEFPEALRASREIYMIIRPGTERSVHMEGVKLASPRRAGEVVKRALAGVPYERIERASLTRIYGRDAAFFVIRAAGDDEWAHAVSERALCFAAKPEHEGIRAMLVWGV